MKKKILFFAEAVTLAHVSRPCVLAKSLDPEQYEVHFACDTRYNTLLGSLPFTRHPLNTIPSAAFLAALDKGKPVYKSQTLIQYVERDLELIQQVKPDTIVGDFRISLSISARLEGIPYITVTNAYWSPYAQQKYPVPDIPLSRMLGYRLAQPLFDLARPLAFAFHTIPFNRARKHFGLPSLGSRLQRVYTDADYVLYADMPALAPDMACLPDNHQFLGPVLWEPDIPLPDWWGKLPDTKPIVYVTLGSSGNSKVLPIIAEALSQLDCSALIATAGASTGLSTGQCGNLYIENYLPGSAAAEKSDLVICNGGSPSVQQAIAGGARVLCIPGNLDQQLNSQAVKEKGRGHCLRVRNLTAKKVGHQVSKLLEERVLPRPEGDENAGSVLARLIADIG